MFISGGYGRGLYSSVLLEVSDIMSLMHQNDLVFIVKFAPNLKIINPPNRKKNTAYNTKTTAYDKNTIAYDHFITEYSEVSTSYIG